MKFELETISQVVQGHLHPSRKSISHNMHADYLKEDGREFIRRYRFFIQKDNEDSFSVESFTLFSLFDPESISGLDPLLARKDQHLIEQLLDICAQKLLFQKKIFRKLRFF